MYGIWPIHGRSDAEELKQKKKAYAKKLFKKYGFNRGTLFEKIPIRYKLNPLWSPSEYSACEGDQIAKWILEGIEEGKKDPFRIKIQNLMKG